MRKMTGAQLFVFFSIFGCIATLGCGCSWLLTDWIGFGEFRPVVMTGGALFLTECFAFIAYRILQLVLPLKEGTKRPGSREEFGYQLYILMNLFFFYPLIYSGVVPIPFLGLIYRLLGAQIGSGSYGNAHISDPPLTVIGEECILGHGALIAAHHNTGKKLSHATVRIGNRVTVGGGTLIGAGVRIQDDVLISAGAAVAPFVRIGKGAIVAPCAYVKTGTRIGENETWAGLPAVCVSASSQDLKAERKEGDSHVSNMAPVEKTAC